MPENDKALTIISDYQTRSPLAADIDTINEVFAENLWERPVHARPWPPQNAVGGA